MANNANYPRIDYVAQLFYIPLVQKLWRFCHTGEIGWFPKTYFFVFENQPTVHSGGVSRKRVINGATPSSFDIGATIRILQERFSGLPHDKM